MERKRTYCRTCGMEIDIFEEGTCGWCVRNKVLSAFLRGKQAGYEEGCEEGYEEGYNECKRQHEVGRK